MDFRGSIVSRCYFMFFSFFILKIREDSPPLHSIALAKNALQVFVYDSPAAAGARCYISLPELTLVSVLADFLLCEGCTCRAYALVLVYVLDHGTDRIAS